VYTPPHFEQAARFSARSRCAGSGSRSSGRQSSASHRRDRVTVFGRRKPFSILAIASGVMVKSPAFGQSGLWL
jgi:hypothetical protein